MAHSNHKHEYRALLTWEGNRGAGTATYAAYDRQFRITMAGKPDLLGSADPAFRGAPDRHNPEELLVAALSSCHMLSYLALCARNGITVLAYSDAAEGEMSTTPDGGRFTSVTLHPRVTVGGPEQVARALELHARAHLECYIASSCNFPVAHHPVVTAG